MPTQYLDPEEEEDDQPNYLAVAPQSIAAPPMGADEQQEEMGLPADAPQTTPMIVAPIPSGADQPIDDGTSPQAIAQAPVTTASLLDDEGQATGPAPVPAIALSPAEAARKKVAELEGQRPVRPKVGWLRTLASIGAGLGAGYANATGKKMPQTDVGALMDNIKYGGYNNKIADWQNQVSDADAQANALESSQSKSAELANKTASTAHLNAETTGLNAPASHDVYHSRAAAATSILGLKPGTPEYQEFVGTGSFKTADGHKYELKEDGKGGWIKFDADKGTAEVVPGLSSPPPKVTNVFEANQAAWRANPANVGKQPTPDVVTSWEPKKEPTTAFEVAYKSFKQKNPGREPTQQELVAMNPFPRGEAAGERQAKETYINQALADSGNDPAALQANLRAGKYTKYQSELAELADKLGKIPAPAQKVVSAAGQTEQLVDEAISKIEAFKVAHPHLIGSISPTRAVEGLFNADPAEVGEIDALFNRIGPLQAGMENMRSSGVLSSTNKALGVDPRSGKYNGQRAWQQNTDKTIDALKELKRMAGVARDETLKAAGHGTPSSTTNANRPSLDQLIPIPR